MVHLEWCHRTEILTYVEGRFDDADERNASTLTHGGVRLG